MQFVITLEAIEATERILTPGNAYPGLVMSGSEESYKKFHDDITIIAETLANIVTDWRKQGGTF